MSDEALVEQTPAVEEKPVEPVVEEKPSIYKCEIDVKIYADKDAFKTSYVVVDNGSIFKNLSYNKSTDEAFDVLIAELDKVRGRLVASKKMEQIRNEDYPLPEQMAMYIPAPFNSFKPFCPFCKDKNCELKTKSTLDIKDNAPSIKCVAFQCLTCKEHFDIDYDTKDKDACIRAMTCNGSIIFYDPDGSLSAAALNKRLTYDNHLRIIAKHIMVDSAVDISSLKIDFAEKKRLTTKLRTLITFS